MKLDRKKKFIIGAFLLGVAIALALPAPWIFRDADHHSHQKATDSGTSWACPMFCVVMDKKPADERCPVCGMELGPVATGSRLSKNERVMIGLEVAALQKIPLVKELILYGEVDWDETRLSVVSARTSGWIEKLTRRISWEEVKEGDVLYELYAPELFEAQQEMLAAAKAPELLQAARQRLSLLGLDDREIDAIAGATTPKRAVARRSPQDGVIVRRDAVEGTYVKQGQEIFRIADLARVWVQLEVFEPDLHWLAPNTRVDLRDVSLGDDVFEGRIVFADPVVDRMTRTARVRVEVTNRRREDGRWALLPGQRIEAQARVAVNDRGRPLAQGEEAGPILAIPRTSVLRTGRRSVIYVLLDEGNQKNPFRLNPNRLPESIGYALVEVDIGPLLRRQTDGPLEEYYPLVRLRAPRDPMAPRVLEEGMVVATKGAFMIDSQAQLSGKPSLLFPQGRQTPTADGHENH